MNQIYFIWRTLEAGNHHYYVESKLCYRRVFEGLLCESHK